MKIPNLLLLACLVNFVKICVSVDVSGAKGDKNFNSLSVQGYSSIRRTDGYNEYRKHSGNKGISGRNKRTLLSGLKFSDWFNNREEYSPSNVSRGTGFWNSLLSILCFSRFTSKFNPNPVTKIHNHNEIKPTTPFFSVHPTQIPLKPEFTTESPKISNTTTVKSTIANNTPPFEIPLIMSNQSQPLISGSTKKPTLTTEGTKISVRAEMNEKNQSFSGTPPLTDQITNLSTLKPTFATEGNKILNITKPAAGNEKNTKPSVRTPLSNQNKPSSTQKPASRVTQKNKTTAKPTSTGPKKPTNTQRPTSTQRTAKPTSTGPKKPITQRPTISTQRTTKPTNLPDNSKIVFPIVLSAGEINPGNSLSTSKPAFINKELNQDGFKVGSPANSYSAGNSLSTSKPAFINMEINQDGSIKIGSPANSYSASSWDPVDESRIRGLESTLRSSTEAVADLNYFGPTFFNEGLPAQGTEATSTIRLVGVTEFSSYPAISSGYEPFNF